MRRWSRRASLLFLLVLVACGGGTPPGPTAFPTPPPTSPATLQATPATPPATPAGASRPAPLPHVFLVVMENHNWADIKGNPSAPYINTTLLPMAAHAERYYNPPGEHPSEPNYLWLEAGQDFGISDDNPPADNHQPSTAHLVSELAAAGIAWKSYQESISGTTCPLTARYPYAPKHNPMVFFDDVTDTNNPHSRTCIEHVRPFGELATDLADNMVPPYSLITPNLCDDMHDDCAPTDDGIKQGDAWLSRTIPMIMRSRAYRDHGTIIITWDEGTGDSDGPIGLLLLSPDGKGGGYSNTIHYTHSSTLRTIQELLGVGPLLGDAAHATDLRDLYRTFPAPASPAR